MTIKSAAKRLLRRFGYDVRKILEGDEAICELEDQSQSFIDFVRANTMLSYTRLLALFKQAVFCEQFGISGSFVECGVWKGGAVGLMALVNLKYGETRRDIHLFDSFQEICEPDAAVDGDRAIREVRNWSRGGGVSGELKPLKGIYDHRGGPGTLVENKELLEARIRYPAEFLHYHVGWFQDTLPQVATTLDQIAILHLDGDWYASTKVCLDHLYDQVVGGGFVIVDDYGAYEGCRKAVDEFLAKLNRPTFLHSVDRECRYWVKEYCSSAPTASSIETEATNYSTKRL